MRHATQSSTDQSLSQVLRYRILISRSVTPSRVATVEKVPNPLSPPPAPFIPRPHVCLCGATPKISRAVYCTADAERLDSTGGGGDHSGVRPLPPRCVVVSDSSIGRKGVTSSRSDEEKPKKEKGRKEEKDERDFRRRMARRHRRKEQTCVHRE